MNMLFRLKMNMLFKLKHTHTNTLRMHPFTSRALQYFWTSWEGGKGFAKRQSMWDAFFIILQSRDEGLGGALLRWLMQVRSIINQHLQYSVLIVILYPPPTPPCIVFSVNTFRDIK